MQGGRSARHLFSFRFHEFSENFTECVSIAPTPLRTTLPSHPTLHPLCLSFKSIKSSCAATHTLGCGAVYWSMENTPRTTFKESRLSPLPAAIDCQAPQPGWNFMPTSPVHAAIWSRLSLSSSCAHCHSCYEFTCAFALLCLENTAPS